MRPSSAPTDAAALSRWIIGALYSSRAYAEPPLDIIPPMVKIASNTPHAHTRAMPAHALRVFALFAILCLALFFAAPRNAYASFEEPIDTSDSVDSFDSSNTEGQPDVFLVVAPNLTWTAINNDSAPNLQYLIANNACANVITQDRVDIDWFLEQPNFHYTRVNTIRISDIDATVAEIYRSMDESDSLIITSSPSLSESLDYTLPGYGVGILVDAGDNGLLTSSTVRRSGLITSGNLGSAMESLLASPQIHPSNLSIFAFSHIMGAIDRTNQLARDNSIAVSVKDTEGFFATAFLITMGITFLFSIVLLFLDIKIKPAFLRHMLPATRILWIIALAMPLATYLMFLQLPMYTTAEITFDYFLFMVMEISFIAFIIALVFRWIYSLVFILGVTVVTLLADQLLGGPMTATGYLSYAPIEAVRYYGIGNEGASLLFGAWIMLSALLLNRSRSEKFSKAFRTWLFPLCTLFVFSVIAAPWWGTNFGVIIWGSVGALVAWSMFNGYRFSMKKVVGMTLVAAFAAFCVLLLDTTFNTESHLGTYAATLQSEEWYLVIPDVIGNMLELSWNTVVFSPALTIAFIVILTFMIVLRVKKPGAYAEFWENNPAFKGGYTALLVTAVIMLFVEDSGILMPALLLLYALAGLIWLVCSNHSWHIRWWMAKRFNEGDTSTATEDKSERSAI